VQKPKRKDRLHDEKVRRWYENLRNGSSETADVKLRRYFESGN
jgi:hypothetical protein